MKRKAIISALLLLLSTCFAWSALAAGFVDNPSFNAKNQMLQPAPTGHRPGKDNGPGIGTHNSGEDCGLCHTPGGKAGNYIFTIGGTVYEDRAARRPLKGAEVILQDIGGNILSMTTNDTGNFWTVEPLSSNPCTLANHGSTEYLYDEVGGNCIPNVPASDSRTWQYKAWVRYGDHVRHMVSIVPVGGATGTSPRMSCNMHHSPLGSSGGVWGARKSTLVSYPTSSLSFKKHVLPIFRNKCAPCHIPGKTITRIVTRSDVATSGSTTVDYSKGRDYTSLAGSTAGTITKSGIGDTSLVNIAVPDQSLLLTKTLLQSAGTVTHAGGGFWSPADLDYKVIRQWIVEGAKDN